MHLLPRIYKSLIAAALTAAPVFGQSWQAPVVPGADVSTLKSSATVYVCNVETDAFLTSGMTWNTNACAVRLVNGDSKASSTQACNVLVSSGQVRIRLTDYSSYFISCLSGDANNIYVDQNSGQYFTYEEDAAHPRTYTLTNTTYHLPLDVTWAYGGHVTLVGGGGHTRWAFIPADSITSGAWARYKARTRLYAVAQAVERSAAANSYATALSEAHRVYADGKASVAALQAASTALFTACCAAIQEPLDVSFLFKNADMQGVASAADWTSTGITFGSGEFEKYHATLTLKQTARVPAGLYDVVFHALDRNDGGTVPLMTVSGASEVAVPVTLIGANDYAVGNTNNNGWVSGGTGLVPDGMRSCAQALTHTDAVTRADNVIVEADGSLTIAIAVTDAKQWFNWQGVQIIWKGSGDASLRKALSAVLADAKALIGQGSGQGREALQAAIDKAQSLYDDAAAPMTALIAARDALLTAMDAYRRSAASPDFPYDVTSYIKNASFEGGFKEWSNDGLHTQSNSSFKKKQGGTYVERWVSSAGSLPDVAVSQTITDLPLGNYRLVAAAQHIIENNAAAQRGVVVFAGTQETTVTQPDDYAITFTHLGQPLTIGLRAVSPTGNWIACDNFRLYYIGGDKAAFDAEFNRLIAEGEALMGAKAHEVATGTLGAALIAARLVAMGGDTSLYAATAVALIQAMEAVRLSAAAYDGLKEAIDAAKDLVSDGHDAGKAAFLAVIAAAEIVWLSDESSLDDIHDTLEALRVATFVYQLAGGHGTAPTVVTNPRYARGSTVIFGRSTVKAASGSRIIEKGFCWSEKPEPTVLDHRTTTFLSNNGAIYKMEGLKPSTRYYIRAYAISDTYAVGYGDVLKVYTIPAGAITYSYNNGGPADANERINKALAEAVDVYWNRLTAIKGLHISCNYGSETPTADCSYGGWMRVGPSASYQQTGTILHEMGHAVGVGTHAVWNNNSPLRENGSRGYWLGDRTNDVLRFWDNDETARLNGDNTHMWPYAINGAHEDLGTEELYTANGLLTQALGEDGLPPTGGFCTPAYVLDQEDDVRYYICSESPAGGLGTAWLCETRLRTVKNATLSAAEAAANDSCAWYITFNPANGYYQLRNAGTGHYLSFVTSSGSSSFKMVTKSAPSSAENLHLMRGRVDAKMPVYDGTTLPVRGYWIIHPENKQNPTCLGTNNTKGVTTATFNLNNNAILQRWVIVSESAMEPLIDTSISIPLPPADPADPNNSPFPNLNSQFFDLQGRAVTHPDQVTPGLYIVNGRKVLIK